MNVLAASSVSFSYLPERDVLRDVSFAVGEGERVALVGSTGDSTGPHLHVQVSAHGVVYNPAGTVPLVRYV